MINKIVVKQRIIEFESNRDKSITSQINKSITDIKSVIKWKSIKK